MATSLVSALTGIPARHDVAMTGEMTLTGRYLPIGGLKEKVLGARRAGIKHIIMPKANEPDLRDIPLHLRSSHALPPLRNRRSGAGRGPGGRPQGPGNPARRRRPPREQAPFLAAWCGRERLGAPLPSPRPVFP